MNTIFEPTITELEEELKDLPCTRCGKSAKYFLYAHGCEDAYACEECKQLMIDIVEGKLTFCGFVECEVCDQPFSTVDSYLKILPL